MLILFLILIFAIQMLVLFCCAAASSHDPVSQAISDQEQMEFLRNWRESHHTSRK